MGLVKLKDYNEKSSMSDYMKESLRESAKTQSKANFGIPDFTVEKYHIPIIVENKLSNNKHVACNKTDIKNTSRAIEELA